MRYFQVIERSNLGPTPFVADVWDLKGLDSEIFTRGTRVFHWPLGVSFTSSNEGNDGELTEFVVNDAMVPLITPKLLDSLARLKVPAFQTLPADVGHSTGKRTECFIINFLALIDVFDLEKSVYDVYPNDWNTESFRGNIWTFDKVVLRKQAVEGWDFFRCAKYTSSLFVSENFVNLFKKNKMKGVSFSEVEVI